MLASRCRRRTLRAMGGLHPSRPSQPEHATFALRLSPGKPYPSGLHTPEQPRFLFSASPSLLSILRAEGYGCSKFYFADISQNLFLVFVTGHPMGSRQTDARVHSPESSTFWASVPARVSLLADLTGSSVPIPRPPGLSDDRRKRQ